MGTWCQLDPEATAEQDGEFCCPPVGAFLLVARGGALGRRQGALRLETRARGTERAQDQLGEARGVLPKVDQRRLLYVNGILLVTFRLS